MQFMDRKLFLTDGQKLYGPCELYKPSELTGRKATQLFQQH